MSKLAGSAEHSMQPAHLISGGVQRDGQLRGAVAHKVLQVRHQAHRGHCDLHSDKRTLNPIPWLEVQVQPAQEEAWE